MLPITIFKKIFAFWKTRIIYIYVICLNFHQVIFYDLHCIRYEIDVFLPAFLSGKHTGAWRTDMAPSTPERRLYGPPNYLVLLADTSGEVITHVSICILTDSITSWLATRWRTARSGREHSKASWCEWNERAQIDRNTRPSMPDIVMCPQSAYVDEN